MPQFSIHIFPSSQGNFSRLNQVRKVRNNNYLAKSEKSKKLSLCNQARWTNSFYVLGDSVCLYVCEYTQMRSFLSLEIMYGCILTFHFSPSRWTPKHPWYLIFSANTGLAGTWAGENKTNKKKDPISSFCCIVSSLLPCHCPWFQKCPSSPCHGSGRGKKNKNTTHIYGIFRRNHINIC